MLPALLWRQPLAIHNVEQDQGFLEEISGAEHMYVKLIRVGNCGTSLNKSLYTCPKSCTQYTWTYCFMTYVYVTVLSLSSVKGLEGQLLRNSLVVRLICS